MGLDIAVHVGPPEKVADSREKMPAELIERVYDEGGFTVFNDTVFAGREKPLENGAVYRTGNFWHFRAGSYSGYGYFREQLAQLAHGKPAGELWTAWAQADDPPEGPFAEQINFSDCEGTIGAEVAAKLAKDYAEFEDRAREALGEDSYEFQTYQQFKRAFEHVASHGGAVVFC